MLKKTLNWTFWILAILLLFFLALIVIIPKFVSTEKGKELSLQWINSRIEGNLKVEKIDLNWFSGQRIEKFSLSDATGKEIASFDSFSTGETLFSFLIGRYRIGQTILNSPRLYLQENQEGELNVAKVFKVKKKKTEDKKHKAKLPKFKGSLSIQDGYMELASANVLLPITLSDIKVDAKDSLSRFRVEAKTKQGQSEGDILIYGQCCHNISVMAVVNNFPVSLFDQLNESKFYESALGNSLNLELELVKKETQLALEANIKTPNLQGQFTGSTQNHIFSLEKGHIVFAITPNFFKAFFGSKEWHLANKPEFIIDIEKLILPLEMKKPDFRQIPFIGTMSMQRAEMTHTDLGILSVNEFKANFSTHPDSDKNLIDLKYKGLVQGKGEPTELDGSIQIYPNRDFDFCTSFKSLPTDVLELVMSSDLPYLHTLLGPQFSLDLNGTYSDHINVNMKLTTTNFDIHGDIAGENLENLKADLEGTIFPPVRLKPYIGLENPLVNIEADLSYHDRNLVIPSLKVEGSNPNITFELLGQIGEKGKPFDFKDVQLRGIGKIHKFSFPQVNLDYHGRLLFTFDGADNETLADAMLTSLSGSDESLVFNFSAKDLIENGSLDIKQAEMDFLGKVRNFPIRFIDSLLNQDIKLENLLGSSLDAETKLHKLPGKTESVYGDVILQSEGFFLTLSLIMDGGLNINPGKPALLHWEMTPERYLYLLHLSGPEKTVDYFLDQKASFDLNIEKFSCPQLPALHLEALVCEGGLKGKITSDQVILKNPKNSASLTIKNLHGTIDADNVSKKISLDLAADILSSHVPENAKSGFSLHTETLDLLTPEGKLNKENLTVKGELSLEYIPVSQMTGILPLKEKTKETANALLGELLNARIYGEISRLAGPLTIDIKASNFKGIFPLQFTLESLTLQKNVEAELTLTEEVNAVILKEVTPILISGAWSDHPLKLYIDANGFYIPLRPFHFGGVQIEKAVLDLGKVRVKNGGEILSLMKFLKAKEVSSEGIMEAWFTPIFINLKNGVANYKRFDALLAGNVHIAMWGGIDIINDRVGMTLGISPATLQRNLDIMGMSKKDMFQVKMRGSTTNLDLDWSSAYTRIGLILTRTAGGHIGYIVGGILEQLLGLVGDEHTPDPTTSPFPWEKGAEPQEGMPQEAVLIEEETAGLRKILNMLIP